MKTLLTFQSSEDAMPPRRLVAWNDNTIQIKVDQYGRKDWGKLKGMQTMLFFSVSRIPSALRGHRHHLQRPLQPIRTFFLANLVLPLASIDVFADAFPQISEGSSSSSSQPRTCWHPCWNDDVCITTTFTMTDSFSVPQNSQRAQVCRQGSGPPCALR